MRFYRLISKILLIFLTGLLVMISTGCEADYKEPIYYLKFSTARATVDVRLNDVPVLHHDAPGSTESEKAVPESIIDGLNTLQVTLSPLKNEEHLFVDSKSANIKLVVREKNAPLNQYETLIDLSIKAVEEQSQILSDSHKDQGDTAPKLVTYDKSEIVAERGAQIESPFPRWSWQDGQTIQETSQERNSLIEKYREIYVTLTSGDINKVKSLYSEAAKEFAIAYHYDDVEQGHRIINTGQFIGDNDWKIGNAERAIAKGLGTNLEVYADGKLARLVHENGKELLITYRNVEAGLMSFQKFGFYKNKDGEWIMIR